MSKKKNVLVYNSDAHDVQHQALLWLNTRITLAKTNLFFYSPDVYGKNIFYRWTRLIKAVNIDICILYLKHIKNLSEKWDNLTFTFRFNIKRCAQCTRRWYVY